jgi:hypothetical protein
VRQYIARVGSGCGIDRYVSFVDVLNDPVLIDYECGAISETLRFVENAVILHHCSFEIAEEGKSDADVLREAFVSWNAVHAHTENLSIGSFEFGDISLICLQFFRSTTCEGQHVEGQHNILLPLKVAQLHLLTSRAR